MLASAGFQAAGWVRQPRAGGEIEIFNRRGRLNAFLVRSEIVVNLLPLTAETRGIIGAETLEALPSAAARMSSKRI